MKFGDGGEVTEKERGGVHNPCLLSGGRQNDEKKGLTLDRGRSKNTLTTWGREGGPTETFKCH